MISSERQSVIRKIRVIPVTMEILESAETVRIRMVRSSEAQKEIMGMLQEKMMRQPEQMRRRTAVRRRV